MRYICFLFLFFALNNAIAQDLSVSKILDNTLKISDTEGIPVAVEYLDKAIKSNETTLDSLDIIELFRTKAVLYNKWAKVEKEKGDYSKSDSIYNIALGIKGLNTTDKCLINLNYIELLLRRGLYLSAKKSISQIENIDDNSLKFTIDLRRAEICSYLNNYEEALDIYRKINMEYPKFSDSTECNKQI